MILYLLLRRRAGVAGCSYRFSFFFSYVFPDLYLVALDRLFVFEAVDRPLPPPFLPGRSEVTSTAFTGAYRSFAWGRARAAYAA